MRDESPKQPRRRRGNRASEPYADFYTNYYGLDEPSGQPTRHRAAASRTGGALLAGLSALMHRKTVVILTLGLSAVLVLAVGVMASATRTGSDPNHVQSLVDTTGSPTYPATLVPVAGATSTHPAPSSSAAATSGAPVISTPGNIPVYAPPPAVVGATTQAAAPPPSTHSSVQPAPSPTTHHSTPPTTTHTTSSAPPPPPPTSSTPTPTPTPSPSPTKKCLIPDPFHPGKCILAGT